MMPTQGTVVEEIAYLLRAMLDSRVTPQLTGYDSGTVASFVDSRLQMVVRAIRMASFFADRADPYLLR